MIVYRICQSIYAHDLSGHGAKLYGGRWNKKGTPVTYTCGTRALCVLEVAVHLPIGFLPPLYSIVSIEIPENLQLNEVLQSNLPEGWMSFPQPVEVKEIGDSLLRSNEAAVIKVPSAIVSAEYNYLINPLHPTFGQIKIVNIEPFRLDERLIRK